MYQIVTIGLNHICPMVTGLVPHVGGPIIGPGCPGVLVDGLPVSVMGDMCVCCGPPDTIVQGYPGVMVDGVPIVVQNAMTAHGGMVPMGVPGVTISSAQPVQPITMSIKKIPFPKIRMIDTAGAAVTGNSNKLNEAKSNIKELKENAQNQEPMIYNVRWMKDDVHISDTEELEKIKVKASVAGIDEGESIHFDITRTLDTDGSEKKYELSGVVTDGEVEVEIEVEEFLEKNQNDDR